MSTQIPPPFDVPEDKRKDRDNDAPIEHDTPPAERDPSLEQEDYKLPPSEPPATIREPRIPGA